LKEPVTYTLFFDLDGTLTDSREGIIRCIQHALGRMGFPAPPEEDLVHWIGPPLQDTFAAYLNTGKSDVDRVLTYYRERYTTIGIYENRIYPGIKDLLTGLSDFRLTLYVVTSKPWKYAKTVVDGIGLKGFFKAVYGSEMDGRRTNKADLIRYVRSMEEIQPERTLMIGDREHDILAAHRHAINGIGAAWGYGTIEELVNAGALTICETPSELQAFLLSMIRDTDADQNPASPAV